MDLLNNKEAAEMFEKEQRELVQAYLNKANKIKGLYVLSVGEMTQAELHELMTAWNDFENAGYIDAPLVVVPNDTVLSYENRFTFERAMQIVRAGGKVRRLIWHPKEYIAIDMAEDVSLFREEDCLKDYVISQDDLEAVDWIFYEDKA